MLKIVRYFYIGALILNIGMIASAVEMNAPMEPQKMATISEATGTVEVKPATEKAVWVAGTASTSLIKGDTIRTGKDSTATIHINDGSGSIVVKLASDSILSITELMNNVSTGAKNVLLSLDLGEAMVRTKNTDKRSNFEIKTPTSIVSSQGGSSSFSVSSEYSGK